MIVISVKVVIKFKNVIYNFINPTGPVTLVWVEVQ